MYEISNNRLIPIFVINLSIVLRLQVHRRTNKNIVFLTDEREQCIAMKTWEQFPGFKRKTHTTADSNKEVVYSSVTLRRSERLYRDIDVNLNIKHCFPVSLVAGNFVSA